MAAVTAQLVKELRGKTGAGMMDCKKALTECNGDIDASIEFLRKKGLAKAAKKGNRIATEGAIVIEDSDSKKVSMTEINCETDFVTKNETFKELTGLTVKHIHSVGISTNEELLTTTIDGVTFEEFLKEQITKIGENIVVRRFVSLEATEGGLVSSYLHSNGKVGVIIAAKEKLMMQIKVY
jgi:elongation factor Ts